MQFPVCLDSSRCCHSGVSSLPSLPTSVCTKEKKKEKLVSSSIEVNIEHYTLTNTDMQKAGRPEVRVKKIALLASVSEHASVQWCVHNDLKREWLCVIDDSMTHLNFCCDGLVTPKYGAAYACSFVLLPWVIRLFVLRVDEEATLLSVMRVVF